MLRGLQQREGVERSVDCVSAELCYENCSRGKELSAVLTVLALNCYESCSRGKELSSVLTVLALNCVTRAAAEGRSWAECLQC